MSKHVAISPEEAADRLAIREILEEITSETAAVFAAHRQPAPKQSDVRSGLVRLAIPASARRMQIVEQSGVSV
jgi:hypothetical protein